MKTPPRRGPTTTPICPTPMARPVYTVHRSAPMMTFREERPLTRTNSRFASTQNNSDGTIDKPSCTDTSHRAATDEHGRRVGGSADGGTHLEDQEEEQKGPLNKPSAASLGLACGFRPYLCVEVGEQLARERLDRRTTSLSVQTPATGVPDTTNLASWYAPTYQPTSWSLWKSLVIWGIACPGISTHLPGDAENPSLPC